MLYHADEYLAGQAFPNDVFSLRRQHRRVAPQPRRRVHRQVAHREGEVRLHRVALRRLLPEDVRRADHDRRVGRTTRCSSRRASMVLDLLLFDIALHIQKGNDGATHGRSYMKDKSVATDQDIFNLSKLLFDDTQPRATTRPATPARRCMARAQRYRLPAVILRVAQSKHTTVDQEHMGVPLDPRAPVDPTADRHRRPLVLRPGEGRVLVGAGRADRVADRPAHDRHPRPVRPVGVGLLQAVQAARRPHRRRPQRRAEPRAVARADARVRAAHRGRHVHLPLRLGDAVDRAVVPARALRASSTTSRRRRSTSRRSSSRRTRRTSRSPARSGPTTTATGPATAACRAPRSTARSRSASTRRSSRTPDRRSPRSATSTTPTRTSRRSGSTRSSSRTAGRSGARATATSRCGRGGRRSGAPTPTRAIFTHGLTQPFDLVAPGGADDVWFTQVGDATQVRRLRRVPGRGARAARSRSRPARRCRTALRRRLRRDATSRRPRAPSRSGPPAPLHGEGQPTSRSTPASATTTRGRSSRLRRIGSITIADKAGALKLDFAHGSRVTSVTGR